MYITQAQISHLQNYTEEAFVGRVMQVVADQQAADLNDPALRSKCEGLVHQARQWGFSTELEVATYALCGYLVGADFPGVEGLPFRNLLQAAGVTHAEKADRMMDLLEQYQDGSMGEAADHE